ncbi:cobalamin biosynthesis protein [Clostridium botulinum]|uniref:Cobalamin biosynthesis protein CobD n=1 Tax=Clostridium botulinum (strain Eklund 17B / Type B) TaxID=935198 RepID=B2TPE9_CLOBB|nr:cobalamin biosynthesis protein CobD [Clostridium botulinum B str. Eklund 17B (NRP)]MBY6975290.1 cobalamin biosynthesis protein [Clostridium botulinum]MBY7000839.1 cobalamin biosynthesis protein [Clostridium botulinum]MCR1273605.1 cobalamin biosynthesis protein [Clostridium botulinum]NFD69625.1 cobalamin biosynthesis protein [Clostridium botulinum]
MIELTIGFFLDLIIGDPENPIHPVRIIGNFASKLEKLTRKLFKKCLKIGGLLTWLIVISITFLINFFILKIVSDFNKYLGIFLGGVVIYFCISAKGLVTEGYKVISLVRKDDIKAARKQLSFIVGRDTENLDKQDIIRAVIETIAENMSDGIIAPIFYAGLGGAPLAMAYKAVNTLDSMFGYKNDKYMEFGYFSAKLDDVFNYIPARITGVLIVLSAMILGYDYKRSFKIYKRDRYNHSSPNSAHPEAAMAGILGVQLGGENYYFGKLVKKQTIGESIKEIEVLDVDKTSKVLYCSAILSYILSIILIFIGGHIYG